MQFFEERRRTDDGLELNTYRWIPNSAHSAIVLSHGWSEHAGRYHDLAHWLASKGYEVHAHDHRGHGKSEGKRGHVKRWNDYANDLEQLRLSIDKEHQYLLGHSMGGMIGVLHMLEYPEHFRAAALSGPATDVSYPVPKVKVWISQAMSRWIPALSLSNDIDASIVCGNPDVVDSYVNDPHTHGQVTARWFAEYLKTIERVRKEAHQIRVPVGIWHGAEDRLVEPWVSEAFYAALATEQRQREVLDGALHEILFEKNWTDTATAMCQWLEQH